MRARPLKINMFSKMGTIFKRKFHFPTVDFRRYSLVFGEFSSIFGGPFFGGPKNLEQHPLGLPQTAGGGTSE